jgi:hypothetical protein
MTNNPESPTARSLKISVVCLAFTIAGYLVAFGISYMGGNSYARILIHGGGLSGADQISHGMSMCTGAIVGCLTGGFVSLARVLSPMPRQTH